MHTYIHTGAVKLAEILHSNFVLKYYQYSNLKGIISVKGEKAFGSSPEATRGRIEQNITILMHVKPSLNGSRFSYHFIFIFIYS